MAVSDNHYQLRLHRPQAQERDRSIARLLTAADAGCDRSRSLAGKLCACGRYPTVWARPDGALVTTSARCKSRACPSCGPVRVADLERRVREAVARIDDARMLTLTLAASPAPLGDQITDLKSAWSRLRRRKDFKAHVRGGLTVFECTWNAASQAWHPHLHVVLDGVYWPHAAIKAAWQAVTGSSSIVDIRRVPSREALVKYVAKYVSKSQSPGDLPAARWVEWVHAIHGLRMAQTFGHLHGRKPDAPREADQHGTCEHVASLAALVDDAAHGDRRAARLILAVRLVTGLNRPDRPVDPRNATIRRRLERWRRERVHGPRPRTIDPPAPMPLLPGVDWLAPPEYAG